MAYATCYTWQAIPPCTPFMRCPKCGSVHTRVTCTERTHEKDKGQTWRYSRCLTCLARFKTIESIVPYERDFLNDEFPTNDPNSYMGRYVEKQRNAAPKLGGSQQNLSPAGCR